MVNMRPDDHTESEPRTITSLLLKTSRVLVQWREDGKILVTREDEVPALLGRPADVPSSWRAPLAENAVMAVEEATPGDLDRPSWWVLYGDADPDIQVSVTVDAIPAPTVHRVGAVWACEWTSYPTTAYVHRSDCDTPASIRFSRPMFLPPAPYPQYEN